jgi:hypothetical protein
MAEPKFSKQTITNVSGGPKIINGRSAVLLQHGETVEDVEINDAEFDVAKSSGYFEFGKAAAARAAKDAEAPEGDEAKSPAQVPCQGRAVSSEAGRFR